MFRGFGQPCSDFRGGFVHAFAGATGLPACFTGQAEEGHGRGFGVRSLDKVLSGLQTYGVWSVAAGSYLDLSL